MSILVTGANGFIAGHLISFLKEKEQGEIIGCTRNHFSSQIHNYICDLEDKKSCEGLIKKIKPEQIYHLAGYTNNARSFLEPQKAISSNLEITYNLLEAVRNSCPSARVLITSTSQVYAPGKKTVDESSPLLPNSPYSLSKKLVEEIAKFYLEKYALDVIIARLSNQIGPGQPPEYVASSFARQLALIMLGKKPPELEVGNLKARRDFLDVRDSSYALWLIMNRGIKGEIYNLASGNLITIKQLLDTLIKIANLPEKKVQLTVNKHLYRPEPPSPRISTPKIQTLGFTPSIPLEKSLKDLIDYWVEELRTSSS